MKTKLNYNPYTIGYGSSNVGSSLINELFKNINYLSEGMDDWNERLGSCDVTKSEEEYNVVIDVPGLTKNEIDIEVDNKNIIISGERKKRDTSTEITFIRSERSYRRFERSWRLPEDVDVEGLTATVRNGVLNIVLPRISTTPKKQKIEIN